MKRFDRRALFASGAAAALLAATGVAAAPQRGGRLLAALSPALFAKTVRTTLYDSLTEIAADGTLRAELATGWQANSDATEWTFMLRKGVVFHNGAPFDASHVAQLPFDIRIIDPYQITIHLGASNPNLPYHLAQPGFEIVSDAGTGLYQTKKNTRGHFIGTRIQNHWKTQAGWFDTVEFVQFSDENVRAEALREGLVDMAEIRGREFLTHLEGTQSVPSAQAALRQTLSIPFTIGKAWPLDNLRMAERWWMG